MSLVRTTLTAPITASQLTFPVASTASQAFPAVGAPPLNYQPIMVDDEMMFLVSCPGINIVTVRMRGSDGTDAVAHDLGATVVTSATPIDFPTLRPGSLVSRPPDAVDIVTYGTPGVIAVPNEHATNVFLAAPALGAYTLGAPSLALNGLELTITSQTPFAHTVTVPGSSGSTGLYFTAAAGSPFTVATFANVAGATMKLIAIAGAWNVVNASITPVTFT